LDERIKKNLIGIAGRENVSEALVDRINCSQDFSEHRYLPEGTVWPTTTEQVSAVLRLASQEKIPVTPRGGARGPRVWPCPAGGESSWIWYG
jgi:glycolate oxidase